MTYKEEVAAQREELVGKTYTELWAWAAPADAAEGHHPSGVARALALAMHANGLSYPYAGSGSVVEDLGLPRNEEVMDESLLDGELVTLEGNIIGGPDEKGYYTVVIQGLGAIEEGRPNRSGLTAVVAVHAADLHVAPEGYEYEEVQNAARKNIASTRLRF